jgi:hypothetical protein
MRGSRQFVQPPEFHQTPVSSEPIRFALFQEHCDAVGCFVPEMRNEATGSRETGTMVVVADRSA